MGPPGHPENLARLKARGVEVAGPAAGLTACGEEGEGRLLAPPLIAEEVARLLSPGPWPESRSWSPPDPPEHLDPVRFISNPSTGLMGWKWPWLPPLGGEVTLILGPTHLAAPAGVRTLRVVSAEEMYRAVMAEAEGARVIIKSAAVSDFKPAACAPHKIKKAGRQEETCYLQGTADILAELGARKGERVLVGFAAETEELLQNAARKVKEKNLDLLVANDVGARDSGFAVNTNRVHFLTPKGQVESLPLLSKREVAERLMRRLAAILGRRV